MTLAPIQYQPPPPHPTGHAAAASSPQNSRRSLPRLPTRRPGRPALTNNICALQHPPRMFRQPRHDCRRRPFVALYRFRRPARVSDPRRQRVQRQSAFIEAAGTRGGEQRGGDEAAGCLCRSVISYDYTWVRCFRRRHLRFLPRRWIRGVLLGGRRRRLLWRGGQGAGRTWLGAWDAVRSGEVSRIR
jgi:hypothetical protein